MLHTKPTSHFKTLAIISILLCQVLPPINAQQSNPGFPGGVPIFFWLVLGVILLISCVGIICGIATRGRCNGGGYAPGYGGYGPYGGYHHHHNTGCGGGYHDHHHHGGCFGGGMGYSSHHHSGCMH